MTEETETPPARKSRTRAASLLGATLALGVAAGAAGMWWTAERADPLHAFAQDAVAVLRLPGATDASMRGWLLARRDGVPGRALQDLVIRPHAIDGREALEIGNLSPDACARLLRTPPAGVAAAAVAATMDDLAGAPQEEPLSAAAACHGPGPKTVALLVEPPSPPDLGGAPEAAAATGASESGPGACAASGNCRDGGGAYAARTVDVETVGSGGGGGGGAGYAVIVEGGGGGGSGGDFDSTTSGSVTMEATETPTGSTWTVSSGTPATCWRGATTGATTSTTSETLVETGAGVACLTGGTPTTATATIMVPAQAAVAWTSGSTTVQTPVSVKKSNGQDHLLGGDW